MGGGPEFSYEWDGQFDSGDKVITPEGPKEILYGHYFKGLRYYRVRGGSEFLETQLKQYNKSKRKVLKKCS